MNARTSLEDAAQKRRAAAARAKDEKRPETFIAMERYAGAGSPQL
jgi:hypothetical protein